jgi:hypothetical protein
MGGDALEDMHEDNPHPASPPFMSLHFLPAADLITVGLHVHINLVR